MSSFLSRYIVLIAFTAVLHLFGSTPAMAANKDQDLLQYVQDAHKLGLKDEEIREYALKAGWPKMAVDNALASLNGAGKAAGGTGEASTEKQAGPADAAKASPTVEGASPGVDLPDGYHIGAGDVLQIMVWREPDASVPSAIVRPDGKIAMPLLKEVSVVGLSPREAQDLITERLSKFIHGADVTVVVTAINSTKAYIVGAVKREGPISLQYRMTVLQALSEAGGLTDYAKRKKIYVLRTENGKPYRLPFNYDAVLKGERMEENVQVMPDDTIVVPH
ncbi:MAG TPA: polysaccharide biosynthesis/export family protein [Bryobacteraceae bacterium]|nr:polysaccharide biosynthesis/export family protein [Bryobacteraceae bacterium]